MPKPYRIGLDVGGVLIDAPNNTSPSFFGDNFMQATPVLGALEAFGELVQILGADNVFVVSKAGENTQRKTRLWLAAHGFFDTGFNQRNLHFCADWADKTPIAKKFNLDCFVDDRIDVLGYMFSVVRHRVLFGPQPNGLELARLIVARNWSVAMTEITRVRSQKSTG